MKNLKKLVTGYKAALTEHDKQRYRSLADNGQFPKVMVIGCSDSRVNPDYIFNSAPGDLFVVRNVANLIPPYEVDEASHGTSAALEFAVKGLKVEHIVIMGHSLCGGVKACCQGVHADSEVSDDLVFIPKWTSILNHCAEDALSQEPDLSLEDLSNRVELSAIRASLKNLKDFPFIQDGIKNGTLQVHGAYFDIGEAQLYVLDGETDDFLPIE